MKVRPYRPGDYDHIKRRPQDDFGEYSARKTKLMCETGNTYVAEHDGIPIAIWGTTKLWTGVVYVWTIIGQDARGKGVALSKTIKSMLDSYCDAHQIHRCEAYVKSNIEENVRWLKLLGFTYECTHYKAGPNKENLDIYVRL